MGGLEPFLARWASEARQESGPEHSRASTISSRFSRLRAGDDGAARNPWRQARARLAEMNAAGTVEGPAGAVAPRAARPRGRPKRAAADRSRAGEVDYRAGPRAGAPAGSPAKGAARRRSAAADDTRVSVQAPLRAGEPAGRCRQ